MTRRETYLAALLTGMLLNVCWHAIADGDGPRGLVTVVANNPVTHLVTTNRVPHYSTYRQPLCAWCLQPAPDGNVHHIIPQSTCLAMGMPELIHDPRNLVTLCRECHVLIGHLGNTSRDNNELAEMLRTKKRMAAAKEQRDANNTGAAAGSNGVERVCEPESAVGPLPDPQAH